MKANTNANQSAHRRWASGMAAALLGSALLLPGVADAQQRSPVGTWDCLISGGGQQGIAFLTFRDEGTNRSFSGYQLEVSKTGEGAQPNPNSRNPTGVETVRGDPADTNSVSGNTNVYGFGPISGPWNYDEKGRTIGYFIQKLNDGSTVTNYNQMTVYDYTNYLYVVTNVVNNELEFSLRTTNLGVVTFTNEFHTNNFVWSDTNNLGTLYTYSNTDVLVNTNITIDNSGTVTNSISFTGTVSPGKSITLVCKTSYGKITYRGVPLRPSLIDLNGDWYGEKVANKQSNIEFFHLTPTSVYNPWWNAGNKIEGFETLGNYPNIYYTTNGSGPAYAFAGFAMLSSKKKVGFAFQSYSIGESLLRATYGSMSSTKSASTKGIEEPDTAIKFKAHFLNQ